MSFYRKMKKRQPICFFMVHFVMIFILVPMAMFGCTKEGRQEVRKNHIQDIAVKDNGSVKKDNKQFQTPVTGRPEVAPVDMWRLIKDFSYNPIYLQTVTEFDEKEVDVKDIEEQFYAMGEIEVLKMNVLLEDLVKSEKFKTFFCNFSFDCKTNIHVTNSFGRNPYLLMQYDFDLESLEKEPVFLKKSRVYKKSAEDQFDGATSGCLLTQGDSEALQDYAVSTQKRIVRVHSPKGAAALIGYPLRIHYDGEELVMDVAAADMVLRCKGMRNLTDILKHVPSGLVTGIALERQ